MNGFRIFEAYSDGAPSNQFWCQLIIENNFVGRVILENSNIFSGSSKLENEKKIFIRYFILTLIVPFFGGHNRTCPLWLEKYVSVLGDLVALISMNYHLIFEHCNEISWNTRKRKMVLIRSESPLLSFWNFLE